MPAVRRFGDPVNGMTVLKIARTLFIPSFQRAPGWNPGFKGMDPGLKIAGGPTFRMTALQGMIRAGGSNDSDFCLAKSHSC